MENSMPENRRFRHGLPGRHDEKQLGLMPGLFCDDHQQRNARRRELRLALVRSATAPKPAPDRAPTLQAVSGWKGLVGLAVGVRIALLAVLGGAGLLPDPVTPPAT